MGGGGGSWFCVYLPLLAQTVYAMALVLRAASDEGEALLCKLRFACHLQPQAVSLCAFVLERHQRRTGRG